MAGAMCINVVDSSQEVCCPIHPRITNWKNTFIPLRAESVAGFVGAPSAPSVVSVPSCAVLPSAPSCEMVMAEMVSTATQPRYATAMFHSNQPETFPLSAGVSRRMQGMQGMQGAARSSKEQQGAATTGKQ